MRTTSKTKRVKKLEPEPAFPEILGGGNQIEKPTRDSLGAQHEATQRSGGAGAPGTAQKMQTRTRYTNHD